MEREILFIVSCQWTGTRFFHQLISSNEAVGPTCSFGDDNDFSNLVTLPFEDPSKLIDHPLVYNRRFLFKGMRERFERYYLKRHPITNKTRYIVFRAYIGIGFQDVPSCLLLPLLLLKPFEFRVVAPIRHPLTSLLSSVRNLRLQNAKEGWRYRACIQEYFHLMAAMKSYGLRSILPLDMLGAIAPEDRLNRVSQWFQELLGLSLNKEQAEKIIRWQPISDWTDNEYHSILLPEQVEREMQMLVRESKILSLLKRDFDIDYEEAPPIPYSPIERWVRRSNVS